VYSCVPLTTSRSILKGHGINEQFQEFASVDNAQTSQTVHYWTITVANFSLQHRFTWYFLHRGFIRVDFCQWCWLHNKCHIKRFPTLYLPCSDFGHEMLTYQAFKLTNCNVQLGVIFRKYCFKEETTLTSQSEQQFLHINLEMAWIEWKKSKRWIIKEVTHRQKNNLSQET